MKNFYSAQGIALLKAVLILVGGLLLARFLTRAAQKIVNKYASSQQSMLLQKIIYFSIVILFLVAALQQLGFKLSVLLGSAGIATAAIAIASQTSISNIISGIFLILEKSFQVGDRIKVGSTQGVVMSVDLLSVKILSAHNTLIRIPNETLIKAEITNLSRFDARRLDLPLSVSAEQDLGNIKTQLIAIAHDSPLALKTPLPTVVIRAIDSQEVSLQLSVWSEQKHFDSLTDQLYEAILNTFKVNNIQF